MVVARPLLRFAASFLLAFDVPASAVAVFSTIAVRAARSRSSVRRQDSVRILPVPQAVG